MTGIQAGCLLFFSPLLFVKDWHYSAAPENKRCSSISVKADHTGRSLSGKPGLRVRPSFSVHFLVDRLLIKLHQIGVHRKAAVGRSIEYKTFAQLTAQGLGKTLLGVLHNRFTFLS